MIRLKPIRLRFSGLQSYRDEQEISFKELGTMGIFGVFGPTGGGKSTILDAITLALFGKVERAKSGTRGIINQFENNIAVSFEFSLGSGKYLVERLYERDRHDFDSVRNKNARFIELSAESKVLADKATDVDTKVSELLGMSFDDFSRAVVLPQGKFDQFLKLTGGERARMLEHIFFLERYGENLSKKVSELEKNLANKIETTIQLIHQLGDASQANIDLLKEQLDEHRAIVRQREEARQKAEKSLQALEELGQLHNEIIDFEGQIAVLEAEKPQKSREKARLDRALKAEPFRSLLNQAEELVRREAAEAAKLKAGESEALTVKARVKQIETRLKLAKEGETELSRLKELLPDIAVALDLKKRADETKSRINSLSQDLKARIKTLDELKKQGIEKGREQERLSGQIKQLMEEHNKQGLILACRVELENSLNAAAMLQSSEIQENEAREALGKKEKSLAAGWSKLRQAAAQAIPEAEILQDDIPPLLEKVAAIVAEAEAVKNDADRSLEQATLQNMAGVLAEKLIEGGPCPVCGSDNHPQPAQSVDGDSLIKESREKSIRAGEQLERLKKWANEIKVLVGTVENIKTDIMEIYEPNWKTKSTALAKAITQFQTETGILADKLAKGPGADLLVPGESLEKLKAAIRSIKSSYEEAEDRANQLLREIKDLETKEKQISEEVNSLRISYREVNADKNNLETNIGSLQQELMETVKKINNLTGGKDVNEYANFVKSRIQELQSNLDNAVAAWEKVQSEERETEQVLSALKASWEKASEHLGLVQKELEEGWMRDGFVTVQELRDALLSNSEREKIKSELELYNKNLDNLQNSLKDRREKLKDRHFDPVQLEDSRMTLQNVKEEHETAVREEGALQNQLQELIKKQSEWSDLQEKKLQLTEKRETALKLANLLKGRKFVQFLAEEHLNDMTAEASVRLASLTGQRYALELDDSGSFVMRDDYSGGLRRPVNTLSGGETFLTSLSMALALSSKIQLKGQYPLGFFFLDEGFGTLDPEKLEVVMNTLERLHDGQRMVGVITHVQELKTRMPRYLEVEPAQQDGTGSRIAMRKN